MVPILVILVGLLLSVPYVARLHAQAQVTAEQLEKIRGRKVTEAEVREANDLMRKWTEYYKVMDKRRFHIKGEVVDEQGNRLTGVTMLVSKSVSGGWWQNDQSIFIGEYTINGIFEVRESGCEDVRLSFEKGGYYRQSIRFSDDAKANTREIQERIMKGLPVEEPLVGKEGLRIVMEKKGEQVHLGEHNTPLIYNMDGSGEVLDFDLPRTYPMRKVGDISDTDTKSLPPNCLYMIAEKDEVGNIALDTIYPRRIRVTIKGEPGSGFIVYKPRDRYQSGQKSLHEMKQAPESGYEPTMVLEAEDIKMFRTSGRVYGFPFYFKIKNNYGKGLITYCLVSKDGKTIFLSGSIFSNFKGSRNLESIIPLP